MGKVFPVGVFDDGRAGRGGMAHGWEALSGKMAVLARMLHLLYTTTDDRWARPGLALKVLVLVFWGERVLRRNHRFALAPPVLSDMHSHNGVATKLS